MSAQNRPKVPDGADKSHSALPRRNLKPETPISMRRRLQKAAAVNDKADRPPLLTCRSPGLEKPTRGRAWPGKMGGGEGIGNGIGIGIGIGGGEDGGDGIVIIGSLVIRLVSSGLSLFSLFFVVTRLASTEPKVAISLLGEEGALCMGGGVQLSN